MREHGFQSRWGRPPNLTFGCTSSSHACAALTPFGFSIGQLLFFATGNGPSFDVNQPSSSIFAPTLAMLLSLEMSMLGGRPPLTLPQFLNPPR